MYTIYVVSKCIPGKREEYIERLKKEGIVDAVRAEEGCIQYDFYFSEKDADEILLIEAWKSKEDQTVHMTLPHMKKFLEIKPEYVLSGKLGEFEIK